MIDLTGPKLMILLEKLLIDKSTGGITAQSKADIKAYIAKQLPDGPTAPPTTPTTPIAPIDTTGMTPEQIAYTTHLQATQNNTNSRLMKWSGHSVSYQDINGWYSATEFETKPIRKNRKKGFCPFHGQHWSNDAQAEVFGEPQTVPTGSPDKEVCDLHKHMLNKRDQTRELKDWAYVNSSIRDRKSKSWKLSELPANLQNRVIMYLEASDHEPEPQVQVYNQMPGQIAPVNQNPLGLQMGVPGTIACAGCGTLCQQGAQVCAGCGQSPTTAVQKFEGFLGGLVGIGVGLGKAQLDGQIRNQMNMLPKYCGSCGSQNPGSSVSCNTCGASLASHPPPPVQQQQYNAPSQY